MSERVTHACELVAPGHRPAVVARILQQPAVEYRLPSPRPAPAPWPPGRGRVVQRQTIAMDDHEECGLVDQ